MQRVKMKYLYERNGNLQPAISFDEACSLLQISRRWMHKLVSNEAAPTLLKDGNNSFFDLAEFEGWRATRSKQ